jgi:hypothetical protein
MHWIFSFFIPIVHAEESGGGFVPLLKQTQDLLPGGGEAGIDVFLNNAFAILISIGAALAVGVFVYGGLRYLTSSAGVSTENAKGKMQNAVLGLIMLLATWIIFNTINPDLLSLRVTPQQVQTQQQP